jgi:hypothetical protein
MFRKGQIVTFPFLIASVFLLTGCPPPASSHSGNAPPPQEAVFGWLWLRAPRSKFNDPFTLKRTGAPIPTYATSRFYP